MDNIDNVKLDRALVDSFSLQPIKDVYSDFEQGEEVWFMDEDGEPVRVKSITKQAYNGKIYDVDVENDIVLVRRKKNTNINNEISITDKTLSESKDTLSENKLDIGDSNYNNLIDDNINEKADENIEDLGEKSGEKDSKLGRGLGLDSGKENKGENDKQDKYGNRGENRRDNLNNLDEINENNDDGVSNEYSNEIYNEEGEIYAEKTRSWEGGVWSGNSNNGTAYGNATQTSAGKLGKGMSFDGDGDYVLISSPNTNYNNTYSLSMWVYPIDNNNGNYMFDQGYVDGVILYVPTPNSFRYWVDINGTNYNGEFYTFSLNNWYNIIYTYNGSNFSIYVNGNITTSFSASGNLRGSNNNIYIGEYSGATATTSFNGTIDDVMIFNRSLSAEEIAGLYANTSTKYVSNNFTGLADGSHSFKAYAQDEAGNIANTSLRSITTDTAFPTLNVTSPVNSSYYNSSSVLFNVSSSELGTGSIIPDIDNSLVSWWRMDDTNQSVGTYGAKVYDYKGCYDNETEILTRVEVNCESGDYDYVEFDEIDENDGINYLTVTDALSLDEPDIHINNENSNLDNSINNINNEQSNDNNITASESNKNKENATENVASKAMQILTDYNNSSNNIYINFSVDK